MARRRGVNILNKVNISTDVNLFLLVLCNVVEALLLTHSASVLVLLLLLLNWELS